MFWGLEFKVWNPAKTGFYYNVSAKTVKARQSLVVFRPKTRKSDWIPVQLGYSTVCCFVSQKTAALQVQLADV
jgi:hypothetical protein